MTSKTIFDLSPLLASFIDGSFAKLEEVIVPFIVAGEEFEQMFILVDVIYPELARFVKGYKIPTDDIEKWFTAWQEAVRKDIECAFGILQAKFQCLARPLYELKLERIGLKMNTCLVLHNMCVADRVMGDVRAVYNPAENVLTHDTAGDPQLVVVEQPEDLAETQGGTLESDRTRTGIDRVDDATARRIARRQAWSNLKNEAEYVRLHMALMRQIVRPGAKKYTLNRDN